ncbi:DNA polymerase III, delta prime subunit [Chthonomonas calidirosea]|uniref:DNA polymerase III subunit n=1 Tax=Chthonomonas calidirosea TaxID=454171 RepID=UPI0006DD4A2A|nr:hypothetical protein [Chthonomonas calidirosea]CEK20200.1 DNA polymerase III, delta prime subunit [Chthonomonas calidirosea]
MPRFADLVGQEPAINALRKAITQGRFHGTWLMVGSPGVGRGTLARTLAQVVACQTPKRDPLDACGVCVSCRYADAGSHPEILTIRPAGEQIQIWQLWDRNGRPPGALSHTLSFAPVIGRKRVYILEQVERLTEAAANSLLKVLEEPPPYALFILTAPHPSRVLPTIVSRSQVLRLLPLPQTALADYLRQLFALEPAQAYQVAAISEGRIGQGIRLASNPQALREIENVFELIEMIAVAPKGRALRLGEQMRRLAGELKSFFEEEAANSESEEGEPSVQREQAARRQFAALFDLMIIFYRDLFLLSTCGPEAAIVNVHRRSALAHIAQKASPQRWQHAIAAILLARRRLDFNANIPLLTDTLLMQLLAD